MGMFLSKRSFKIGIFSDPQRTHPGIFILESPLPGDLKTSQLPVHL